jgi:exopolysaccharide biosynthesis polyprenyl glycosylphosphotransferase
VITELVSLTDRTAVIAEPKLRIAMPDNVPSRRVRKVTHYARSLIMDMPLAAWTYLDAVVVALAVALAGWGGVLAYQGLAWTWHVAAAGSAFSFGIAVAGTVCGLYERQTFMARSRVLVRSTATLALGLTLGYACLCLVLGRHPNPWLPLTVGTIYMAVMVPLRMAAHQIITATPARVLFIGAGPSIRSILELLDASGDKHCLPCGYVRVDGCRDTLTARSLDHGLRCLGDIHEIVEILEREMIDEVVIGAELPGDAAVGQAALACLHQRCRVTEQSAFHERLLQAVPVTDITAQWFVLADVQTSAGYEAVKRIMDVVVALVGLFLTLPLWPLIVLAIRLDSRGPALFRQRRVGLHGACFTMYKFRTMGLDAEHEGPRWASANDVRVTRLGRFLRNSRLDELPQLLNILRGEMSLVGPRPERPEFVGQLAQQIPHYHQRHLVPPGLTGWAQIQCGYGASVADAQRKLSYDLYYLKRRSIDLDVAILLRTLRKFVNGAR